jgi:hypothetical protein
MARSHPALTQSHPEGVGQQHQVVQPERRLVDERDERADEDRDRFALVLDENALPPLAVDRARVTNDLIAEIREHLT